MNREPLKAKTVEFIEWYFGKIKSHRMLSTRGLGYCIINCGFSLADDVKHLSSEESMLLTVYYKAHFFDLSLMFSSELSYDSIHLTPTFAMSKAWTDMVKWLGIING